MRIWLHFFQRSHCWLPALLGSCLCLSSFGESPTAKPDSGLRVTYFGADKSVDVTTAPNVWLYVPAGKSPTPFLSGEKFTVEWSGFLSAELRGDYTFQADLNGRLQLELNGAVVLDTIETSTNLSKPVRLSKGTNAFHATFRSPAQGDAFLRLNWKPKKGFLQPIPAFSHFPSADENAGRKLRLGRELLVEFRCLKCHVSSVNGMPELAMDAPSFEGIGSRRNGEWMARWIADPKQLRASTHMPKFFTDEPSKANSTAAFLSSLKMGSARPTAIEPTQKQSDAGKRLFETLHCIACHNAPENAGTDGEKVSLKQVRAKFSSGALVDFLKQPDLHYAWIRMPTFKLSDDQREQLAAYLIFNSDTPEKKVASAETSEIERGKKLVQTSGCLNCHSLKLANEFSTKTLTQISNWRVGCLAEKSMENSQAPHFNFSAEEREAMQLFIATDRAALSRNVAAEFAERQMRNLNCIECHSKIEGVPRLEILGAKLKPEWSAKFLAGQVTYKPRPWMAAQMPAFAKRATLLAEGLAMQHGISPRTVVGADLNPQMIEAGRKLVSSSPHGFSCISCHAVGEAGASQVFESPGVNLAHSGERLFPEFFQRWLRSPSSIDPITKMPTYFDEEGNSPLTDVYDGNGEKQINAMWQYLRLGEKMPAPTLE